ncbi:unnamed protein product [Spirodela intermedia]|uniref:LOB domain-containing protein n=1 Tax=Spirodela intermedia TaxID=51605 RepID=A0A7I8KDY9_SPIIN|nr:unnamed protein product [Spirodela intermedia]
MRGMPIHAAKVRLYFPQEESTRFFNVHRVFGASNVAKILTDLPPASCRDSGTPLCFEVEVQLQDPIHRCLRRPVPAPGPRLRPDVVADGEPPYHHPLQITEQQDVLQGGDQHQHKHQNHCPSPHQQLDTKRYNGGIRDSGGAVYGASSGSVEIPRPVHHHPYNQEEQQK